MFTTLLVVKAACGAMATYYVCKGLLTELGRLFNLE